jgi:hypothetical protein
MRAAQREQIESVELAAVDPSTWLQEREGGTTTDEVLRFFDALPTVAPSEMFGRWRGASLPTQHPMDGMLEALGWYGKEMIDVETVHPLLFGPRGETRMEPRYVPTRLMQVRFSPAMRRALGAVFPLVLPLVQARSSAARLRSLEHRGVTTTAMIYDRLPIADLFRRVDATRMLGLMDVKGATAPFFFVLTREQR